MISRGLLQRIATRYNQQKHGMMALVYLVLVFTGNQALSQSSNIWSVTSNNGAHGYGTIFYLQPDGIGFTKVHDFDGVKGYPFASLTLSNGKLWGMTMGETGRPDDSSKSGHGAIFTLNPDGSGFENIHSFNGLNGSRPLGELIEHGGKLWGMTNEGGQHNQGVIFTINMDGNSFQKIHDFNGVLGSAPRNSLLIHEGKFWGTTSHGGKNDMGVIFSLKTGGDGYGVVYDFERRNGGEPESGLTFFSGKLWGMTARGGKHNEGSIFYMNVDGTNFTKVHDFIYPTLGDLIPSNNKLWAMMSLRGDNNAGVIFNVDEDGYQAVHHFDKANGRFPEGNLFEHNELLWGMTRFGGANNLGVIFTINPKSGRFKKLFDFSKTTGGVPYGTLIAVPSQNK